ncbi:LamB/YcsF family protein [Vulgatibacter incomptus]|uniref:Lactam utilization protein LamB n=1 Tax=Vulgatibacter incomptus TaxID=1391653 RepID=A0A0K1PGX8_9BACT|nr:LamB/YcsF family protein [Vulgatibacter incomptus]AKU92752.1 Lactam utilization protein LamB [Vulgatibacter incomptus]
MDGTKGSGARVDGGRVPFLNIDLGELPEEPIELYEYAQLANIACGGHAGDAASMNRALRRCMRSRVRAGAHPSYPDREHFGRRSQAVTPAALRSEVRTQCEGLAVVARDLGIVIEAVKPHGALYHDANRDSELAAALIAGAVDVLGGITILGPPGGALASSALAAGLAFAREGFADRGMLPSGELVPRDQPHALVGDPALAAAQAVRLAALGRYDTLCVHGDSPGSVAIARAVREALDAWASATP